jgi:two-component system, NtrC family, sensor histidine kinase HydH
MLRKALSIHHILLVAFLLAGLLPATIITAMTFSKARDALEAEIRHDMQARASSTIAEIDRMMFERLQNIASWSTLEIMQELRIGDVDKRLSRFLGELKTSYSGVYVELHAVNADHIIVASSEPGRLGQKFTPTANGSETKFGRNGAQAMRLEGNRLPLSAKIPDALRGGYAGTLYAVFDWGQVRQILAAASAGNSAVALFDHNGQLLAKTREWAKYPSQPSISATATALGYQGFPGFGWKVAVAQPRSIALAPVYQMARAFMVLLISTIAIAALAAIPIASGIARPLGRLTDFTRHFIREQRVVPPPTGGPAEVRELSTAFNQMIQDLERLKENLTHAAKLAMVGEMAAALTHEVRTPLGILRTSAQLLLREPALSADGREVCGFIISETERMNRLISTLLDSARARPPELAAVNWSTLAQQTISMLQSQADKKNITLILCTTADASETIAECDKEQMTQVLLNLLLNALQILPVGGRVEIEVRREADTMVLEVADDGPGIAPDLYDRVFDPFFTKREGGIGLGLAVVRQIVEAHCGEITAGRSHLGGALFRVRLPVSGKENL